MSQVKEIDLQQMAPLRDVSQKISAFLHKTLTGYLSPLTPLFSPQRILGEYLEGFSRDRVVGADKSFTLLEEHYVRLCQETFRLPSKLRSPVPAIATRLNIYPWEYLYQVGKDASRTITISSPVKWVLAYDLPYTLSNLLKAQLTGDKPQPDETKQLIINSVIMWMNMERSAGIKQIFEDLRFPVSVDTSSVSGEMPYIVINAAVESFRPQDDIIQTVIMLSGRPVFEELVDLDALQKITDPLVTRINKLVD